MFRESEYRASNGLTTMLLLILLEIAALVALLKGVQSASPIQSLASVLAFGLIAVLLGGLFIVNPGDAKALILFGSYKGTVKQPGFWWANPFLTKRTISLRVRNFETQKLKVNDKNANPIEIAAIVVWKVIETAEALFEVEDYGTYVAVQSESAVRAVAGTRPYDSHVDGEQSLSTHTDEVSAALQAAIQERLARAGVQVIEARVSHLAYSPEIAQAMLQRQQASAIVAARAKIVEGAVGMVETALQMLSAKGLVVLDDERKAQMVSNLLVVLCSERSAQPVVNTGTIYQ